MNDQELVLWKQARLELLGFANYLEKRNRNITAAQVRMAVKWADVGVSKSLSVEQALAEIKKWELTDEELKELEK